MGEETVSNNALDASRGDAHVPAVIEPERYVVGQLASDIVLYSYPSLVRLEAKGEFPRRIHLGPGRCVWPLNDIYTWMQARIDLPRTGCCTNTRIQMGDRFIGYRQLQRIVPYSKSYVYLLEAAGKFPGRIVLGQHRVAWLEREVKDWVRQCMLNPNNE